MFNTFDRDDLWAITTYFNPIGYDRRLKNYREFRKRLGVPLVCVELAGDGRFQLQPNDAEILVRVRDGSLLWQKERLLNIAWNLVPVACDKIMWIDCDVFFEERDWADRISRALDDHPLVHPFSRVADLDPDADVRNGRPTFDGDYGTTIVKVTREGRANSSGHLSPDGRHRVSHSGLCWAVRREVFEDLGFYDVCVLGNGDRAMFCAAADRIPEAVSRLRMNATWERHYRDWAGRLQERIRNRVEYLDLTINHLWHGSLVNRRYLDRYEPFAAHGFDPVADIRLGEDGCWKWATDKPSMHDYVRNYFIGRREDG